MIIGSDSGWLILAGMMAATGDFVADEFRGDFFRNAGAKALAGVLAGEQARHFFRLAGRWPSGCPGIHGDAGFPNRHIFHFGVMMPRRA